MKHKFKIISTLIILCCLICVSATGCKTRYWEINHPVEEITQILVIKETPSGYDEIIEIDRQFYEECVDDILKLEAHKYFPSLTYPHGSAFKIIFNNGEYDLITEWEPRHWTLDEDGNISSPRISWLHFNAEPFNQAIEKWLNYTD